MKDLFEFAPCGLIAFADDGRILGSNQTLQEWLGYSAEEILQAKFDTLLSISSRIFHQTHFLPLLRLEVKADEIFLTLRTRSGEKIPVLLNAKRRPVEGDFLCALMPVYQRQKYEEEILSAKKRAEEALQSNEELRAVRTQLEARLLELDNIVASVEQKNREQTRFSEIVSHDLREPVRKIMLLGDLLTQPQNSGIDDEGRMALERINANCLRINKILRILQEFFSAENKGLLSQNINLNQRLEMAKNRVLAEGSSNISIAHDPLPLIEGYSEQLTTFFQLLIRDALQRQGPDPLLIKIAGVQIQNNRFQKIQDKYQYIDVVQLTWFDNGQELSSKNGEALFQLLNRQHNNGVFNAGLPICRKIVENHHGSISLASPDEKGARFNIIFPLKQLHYAPESWVERPID